MNFLFKNLRRYDFLRIAGIVELELLTSLKTILFQLTEIEWSFEMFYFFSFRVNFVNRIFIF